jgi:hypothetical protein
MNKNQSITIWYEYYEITAWIDGGIEVLFGSFDKSECLYEKAAETSNWKEEGYKDIKIVSRLTEEQPDLEIYERTYARAVSVDGMLFIREKGIRGYGGNS